MRLIASDPNWFDGKAVDELRHVSQFEGMRYAIGFPDMHSGMDTPNGAAFLSEEIFYPHLIGNDIGCGYGFWQTGLKHRKLKIDRWTKRLTNLDQPWEGNAAEWIEERGLRSSEHDKGMGTIGGGNHFAELQKVDNVFDQDALATESIDIDNIYLLVHSGSRSLGQSIMRAHCDSFCADGLRSDSSNAKLYIEKHDHAVKWAQANRELIANRFVGQINTDAHLVLDLPHNSLEHVAVGNQCHWLHRKGVSPTDRGLVIIPGSRGTLSYLVKPITNSIEHAWSIAHGAGRKWDRNSTESRMRERFRKEALVQTELGGRVICEDKSLLFQEAPQAYKNIDKVVQHLIDAGLIEVVATLRPLITYKKRSVR